MDIKFRIVANGCMSERDVLSGMPQAGLKEYPLLTDFQVFLTSEITDFHAFQLFFKLGNVSIPLNLGGSVNRFLAVLFLYQE